jgi:hypothetical protein
MKFNFATALAALSALPALGQLVNESVNAIETAVPASGVVGQKIAIVGSYIQKGAASVATGVQEIEAMIPIALNFATEVLQLAEAVKTGSVTAIAGATGAAAPPASATAAK